MKYEFDSSFLFSFSRPYVCFSMMAQNIASRIGWDNGSVLGTLSLQLFLGGTLSNEIIVLKGFTALHKSSVQCNIMEINKTHRSDYTINLEWISMLASATPLTVFDQLQNSQIVILWPRKLFSDSPLSMDKACISLSFLTFNVS